MNSIDEKTTTRQQPTALDERMGSGVPIIRVFPKRNKWIPTDKLAFVGNPDLFIPRDHKIPVRISIVFTWDIAEGKRLFKSWESFYEDVKLGGPAFDDPGGEFTPGMYIKEGVTITSRGCIKRCPWCFVPKREGKLRELDIKPGHIIQDNNLLACSEKHIRAVFDMLKKLNKPAKFSGGLDTTLLKEWHRELFDSIKIGELWFACDTRAALKPLERAARILEGISQQKRRCYVMIGYNGESIRDAEDRLEKVYRLGFDPFCQLYQSEVKKEYGKEWRALARKWSRPAAYRAPQNEKHDARR
jgi:hypothetical protein